MNEKKYIVKTARVLAGKRGGPKDVLQDGVITLSDAEAAPLLKKKYIAPIKDRDVAVSSKLIEAIGKLDPADDSLWTSDGRPQVSALSAITGEDVSAKDRNIAWGEYQDRLEKEGK